MRSSGNEFSYVDTTNNMGFFAKAIIEGLKGYADAGDMNHIYFTWRIGGLYKESSTTTNS